MLLLALNILMLVFIVKSRARIQFLHSQSVEDDTLVTPVASHKMALPAHHKIK